MKVFRYLVLFALFIGVLNADYILKYKIDDKPLVFLYKDKNHMKLIAESSKNSISEVYYINGKTYNVGDNEGMLMVVDVDKIKQNMANSGISFSMNSETQMPDFKIKRTGKRKKITGTRGEVWIVKDPEYNEEFKVVVTKDKTINYLTKKMFKLFSAFSGGDENYFEIKKGYVAIEGDGVKLISLKKAHLKRKDFTIPKKSRTKKHYKKRSSYFSKHNQRKMYEPQHEKVPK